MNDGGEAMTALEQFEGGLSVHVYGAEKLPAGTVIAFTITIGAGGVPIATPATVEEPPPAEAQKPRRYINGPSL